MLAVNEAGFATVQLTGASISPGPDYLLVENVAVLPAFQGRRYGRRLMKHAEALAASLGLPEMRLYTNKDFAGNVRLYLSLGYPVDREEAFMGGITGYLSKRIASQGIMK